MARYSEQVMKMIRDNNLVVTETAIDYLGIYCEVEITKGGNSLAFMPRMHRSEIKQWVEDMLKPVQPSIAKIHLT